MLPLQKKRYIVDNHGMNNSILVVNDDPVSHLLLASHPNVFFSHTFAAKTSPLLPTCQRSCLVMVYPSRWGIYRWNLGRSNSSSGPMKI